MAYDDRDYFQTKPRFEFNPGLPGGTKGLMIAVIAAFVVGIVVSNQLGYTGDGSEFWAAYAAGDGKALAAYNLYVLVPQNVIPVGGEFSPGHWKLLTHWLVPSGIIVAVIDVLLIYFAGRLIEPLFGTKRYLILFVGACILSGLLASLVDPWLVGGDRLSVIMGPGGGVFAAFTSMIWIAPDEKSFFGLKIKTIILIFLGIAAVMGLIAMFAGGVAVSSPTQVLMGAGIAAGYMSWQKTRGRVPSFTGAPARGGKGEPWEEDGYLHGYKDDGDSDKKFAKAADKQRRQAEEERKRRREEQEKLDAILAKISQNGMTALTRSEKKFLDRQSKSKR